MAGVAGNVVEAAARSAAFSNAFLLKSAEEAV
jgi:hypothetical protein